MSKIIGTLTTKLHLTPAGKAGELVQGPGIGSVGDEEGAVKGFDDDPCAEQQRGDEDNLPVARDAHAQVGGCVHGSWRDPHDPRTHVPDLKF